MMVNIDSIIAYESGELDDDDIVELFAELVETGEAWQLQGAYGRTASALIAAGVINDDGTVNVWPSNAEGWNDYKNGKG